MHRIIIIESLINIKPLIRSWELGGGIVNAAFVRGEKSRKGCCRGADLPQDLLESHAKELALKKKLFRDQVASMKVGDLRTLAKENKVKHWQLANKNELVMLFTETDPAKARFGKNMRSCWKSMAAKRTPTMAQPKFCRFKDNRYRRLEGGIVPVAVCL